MIYHECCLPVAEAGLVAEVVPLAAHAAPVAEIAIVKDVLYLRLFCSCIWCSSL